MSERGEGGHLGRVDHIPLPRSTVHTVQLRAFTATSPESDELELFDDQLTDLGTVTLSPPIAPPPPLGDSCAMPGLACCDVDLPHAEHGLLDALRIRIADQLHELRWDDLPNSPNLSTSQPHIDSFAGRDPCAVIAR